MHWRNTTQRTPRLDPSSLYWSRCSSESPSCWSLSSDSFRRAVERQSRIPSNPGNIVPWVHLFFRSLKANGLESVSGVTKLFGERNGIGYNAQWNSFVGCSDP